MKIIAEGLRFPEGPVVLDDGSICVVEIAAGRVSIVKDGKLSVLAELGGGPNGMAIGPDGALYVCNNGGFIVREVEGETRVVHGLVPDDYQTGLIQRIDLGTREVTTLYTHCGEHPLSAPNDLVFDRHGGFYFTDFGKVHERHRDWGSVYYAMPDGTSIIEVIHPIAAPNGIGLSPDQGTLYVCETETSRLWSYPIVSPGKVTRQDFPSPNGGRLVYSPPGYQRFDSLAVQANGDICVATLITGQVTVVSPEGRLVREVRFPDRYVTNLCFGGAGLTKAYATLSLTGKLVELDWPEPGLLLNYSA
ncbi:MAG: SMP-30/gluconolactonase/LRE family protein [Comamonadaceae bacterium]|nr:MAG: SMP-30/gluconolactonase/LRE family protein [Comamonadaceae bacterium]